MTLDDEKALRQALLTEIGGLCLELQGELQDGGTTLSYLMLVAKPASIPAIIEAMSRAIAALPAASTRDVDLTMSFYERHGDSFTLWTEAGNGDLRAGRLPSDWHRFPYTRPISDGDRVLFRAFKA